MCLLGHCPAGGPMTFNRDAALWHCFVALQKNAEKSPDFLVSRSDSRQNPKAAKWTWNINQLPLRSPDGSVIFKRDVHVNYQRILACSLCFGNFQSGFSLSSGALLGFLPFLAATSSKNFAAPQAFNFNIARPPRDGLVALRLSVLVYDLLSDIYKLFPAFFSL